MKQKLESREGQEAPGFIRGSVTFTPKAPWSSVIVAQDTYRRDPCETHRRVLERAILRYTTCQRCRYRFDGHIGPDRICPRRRASVLRRVER